MFVRKHYERQERHKVHTFSLEYISKNCTPHKGIFWTTSSDIGNVPNLTTLCPGKQQSSTKFEFYKQQLLVFARIASDSSKVWAACLAYPSNDVGVDDGDAGVHEEVRDSALPGRDPAR